MNAPLQSMSWPDFVYKLFTSGKGILSVVLLVAAIVAGGTFVLAAPGSEVTILWGLAKFTKDKRLSTVQPLAQPPEPKDRYRLPYKYALHNQPTTLLDNNINISYIGNQLFIGGANVSLLSIAARGSDGHAFRVRRHDNDLALGFVDQTYIEIEYKGNVYAITVYDDEGEGERRGIIDSIPQATLSLTSYKQLG